jgi:hypothetical protein
MLVFVCTVSLAAFSNWFDERLCVSYSSLLSITDLMNVCVCMCVCTLSLTAFSNWLDESLGVSYSLLLSINDLMNACVCAFL